MYIDNNVHLDTLYFLNKIIFFFQRQSEASDERLRLLQNDKELLAHQVHMLSEQVSAQNEKINNLELLINDKAQHVSTAEELLQRVRRKKKVEMEIVYSTDEKR